MKEGDVEPGMRPPVGGLFAEGAQEAPVGKGLEAPDLMLKVFILALAVWREARGEPFKGQVAVAQVIENRVLDGRWPDTYRDVVLQRLQFSAFNADDPNALAFPEPGDASWARASAAAITVLVSPDDLANGANHYVNLSVAQPSWAVPEKLVKAVGAHSFYRL